MSFPPQPSPHFTWAEMGVPDPAKAPAEIVQAIAHLCCTLLEPIRTHFGKPVHVTSGWRDVALQERIWQAEVTKCGGDEAEARLHVAPPGHSQHNFGRAADIWIEGVTPAELAVAAKKVPALGGVGIYPTFTHVDTRPRAGGVIAQW